MADSDLSLLFRLRAENTQAKAVIADTRQAVNQLRQSFGPQLTQTVTVANKAFTNLGDDLQNFVAQRLGVVGAAVIKVTDALKELGKESAPKSEKSIASVAKSIQSIATESHKTTQQISSFLAKFVQIEGQANRDKAAIDFFGASLGAKLIPELEETGTALAGVAGESAAMGSSIAAVAGPIGIAVAAMAALAAGAVLAAKEIFDLSKAAASFQGKLFDLSQQTGVSVETLSAFELVARTTGSSIEALTQSLGIFQKNLQDAVEDRGGNAAIAFRRLNVDARDTETALRQTIAALAKMPEGFQQTALALEVFGRGGKAFLAIAKESNGDIDKIIEKMQKLGLVTTDQAKLADEFNDQMVLLEIQLRGLGAQAIPIVLDALKDLSKFLADNRDLFLALQGIVKAFAITIVGPIRAALSAFKTQLEAIEAVTRKIKEAIEFISGHPINPFASSTPTPTGQTSPQSAPQVDPFIEGVKDEIEARQRLQGVLNFELAQRQQQAQSSIALAQRELEAGKRTRQQLVDATIDGTRKQTQAQIDQLNIERQIKLQEIALAKDDLQKRDQIANAITAIDTQIATKRAEQARSEADLRAKAQLEERRADLAHEQARLDTLARLGEQRIAVIEDLLKREKVAREVGLEEIEKIENTTLQARGQLLKKELELAGVGPERQPVLDKIRALEADRTALERSQSERRKQLTRDEFEQKRQILLSNLDALLQIEQTRGNAQIATIQAQAALRIKTEEQAAKEILAIRLRLLDSQIEATEAKQKAATGITDPQERRQTQAQLANDLKLLNAEREAIQEDGNRAIDEGRQKDLENERRYAAALIAIRRETLDAQRDIARAVIELMILNFARRKDIIKAQAKADIDEENRRNKQAQDEIRALRRNVAESNRTQEEKLAAQLEIDDLEETEAERHRLVLEEIRRRARLDEKNADPIGRLGLDTDNLKEFARIIEDSIIPLGEILTNTFQQVADAIGQTVQNWVLLGETGPAVMRKILAQALASIAAEAAVNAVKELALGFATLFFNPAESASHFTAAALWGSIAGVAAIAGRGVAGDLFKSKGAGGGAGGGSTSGSGELNPLNLARNAGPGGQQIAPQVQPLRVEINVNDSKFGKAITAHVVEDINNAGPIREVISGDGNLNRG